MSLSLIEKLKLLAQLNKFVNSEQEGFKMKNTTKIVGAIFVLLTGLLEDKQIQHAVLLFIMAHPSVSIAVSGIASLANLLHNPQQNNS